MQRLRGSDAFALYSETPTSPFETIKVAIYRPAAEGEVPGTDEIRDFLKHSIGSTGASRAALRILRVPLDLHHPVWVAAPDFNPDDHIHEAELPAPGNKAQLCDFISDLMSRPLDRDRPLWEVWVIRGLEGGRVALAFKVHHALADGKTVARLVELAHDFRPSEEAFHEHELAAEPVPGTLRLVGDALLDLARSYTLELPHFYRHLKQARRVGETVEDEQDQVVPPFSAPPCILNGAEGGSERVYRYESVSLSGFKALSKHFGCTINTLVIGVCSEALRRYLKERDALPAQTMLTAMPIGDQAGSSLAHMLNSDIHNNNLAVAVVPLFQNIEDFNERLQAIRKAAHAAINHVRHEDGRRFDNYLDFLPGTAVRMLNATMLHLHKTRQLAYANLVISNVPGPKKVLRALDGRLEMEELLSVGNLADGGHLNITVWSYVDRLAFSCYMRSGSLPEPDSLMQHLRDVLDELHASHRELAPSAATG